MTRRGSSGAVAVLVVAALPWAGACGCGATTRVRVTGPHVGAGLRGELAAARPHVLLLVEAVDPGAAPAARARLEAALRGAALATGRIAWVGGGAASGVRPASPAPPDGQGPSVEAHGAAQAREAGADLACVVRLTRAHVTTGVHHVRRYHDAEASAHAVVVDAHNGAVVAASAGRGRASRRARYATAGEALDLAIDRLARHLATGLFGPRPRPLVELVRGGHPALARGAALAEVGDWFGALEAWDALRANLVAGHAEAPDVQAVVAACHYNLGVGCDVVGLPGRARHHLRAAALADPPCDRYSRALTRLEGRLTAPP